MMMSLRSTGLSPQRFTFLLLAVMIVPVAAVIFVNLTRDPFQIFAGDNPPDAVFLGGHGESRFQHAGVIRHFRPQSIVIGHSLAANFLPTRVEKLLGWRRVYSLTMPGATIYEQSLVARFALEYSDVVHVLWLFSPVNLRLGAFTHQPKVYFPHYLYDDFQPNDLAFFATLPTNLTPYVEQKQALRERLRLARSSTKSKVDSRDYATAWHYSKNHKFNVPQQVETSIIGKGKRARILYDKSVLESEPRLSPEDVHNIAIDPESDFFENLQRNVFSLVEANPDTQFTVVILPPLARLYWQHLRSTELDKYKQYLAFIRDATLNLSKLHNIELYAFGLDEFTGDLRLYRDKEHYHIVANDYMLAEISKDKGNISAHNVDQYLSAFDSEVSSYRLPDRWSQLILDDEALKPGKLTTRQAQRILDSHIAD